MNSKKTEALHNALMEIFFTDTIGSCHVETAVEFLERLPDRHIGQVLKLVRLISGSVSDLLAFSFMENVEQALEFLSCAQLEEWVTEALGIYEAGGLQPAKDFLSNSRETTLRYSSKHVAMLRESASDMKLLSAGLSRRDLRFETGPVPHTDTETVFAPNSCSLFAEMGENQLFYRVTIAHKCAQIRYNSFLISRSAVLRAFPRLFEGEKRPAESFGFLLMIRRLQALFPEKDAAALYCLFDTIRIETMLLGEYRGLARNFSLLKSRLRARTEGQNMQFKPDQKSLLFKIALWVLHDYEDEYFPRQSGMEKELLALRRSGATALDAACALNKYLLIEDPPDATLPGRMLPYMGTVFPKNLRSRLQERRNLLEKSFVEIAGALIAERSRLSDSSEQEGLPGEEKPSCACSADQDAAMALVLSGKEGDHADMSEIIETLTMNASQEVRDELRDIVREICQDVGGIPASYVSTALDLAVGTYDSRINQEYGRDEKQVFSFSTYPEWDFRRGAYRKNWCTVKEMMCPAAKGDFVSLTLEQYRGQVASLRRQFELMRQDYRFMRRQRDGEEIDIDAFVEACADIRASVSPSENLYTRLVKDQRDIGVLFLIDMSASTEGWINLAIKESLVLLAAAMELLGDRYAIYGFSGMQRTGCQSFVIKEFEQKYDAAVEERITGISARDYTRMGPAVRHAISRLEQVDARLKILLTLSDGKPEDYDEYKGPYAIEDTRMALFEAREKGIRPFCITVDRQAREYLPRMYGAANYILVPDVKLLHKRVPEIYRILTT